MRMRLAAAAVAACAALLASAASAAADQPKYFYRPVFSAELPADMKVDPAAVAAVRFRMPQPEVNITGPFSITSVPIAGEAAATEEQMAAYIRANNPQPKLTGSVEELVRAYYEEAGAEGVRPDVALAQACKETGFFAYGGDVDWRQNNFCGLGATGGGAQGLSFPDIRTGVRAHIQHLLAYSRTAPPKKPLVDPRYDLIKEKHPEIFGKIAYWTGLNGVWAVPGKDYGEDILLRWALAQRPDASDASLRAAEARVAKNGDAESYLYRGTVYLLRNDSEKAIEDFSTAMKSNPRTLPDPLLCLALAYAQAGRNKDARHAYEVYLDAWVNDADAWYNYGLVLLDMNDAKGSDAAFQKALELTPYGGAHICGARAIAAVRAKNYKAAWRFLAEAAAKDPADTDILSNQIILNACLKPAARGKKTR
ncbi:glucosaminidase domain-containing protein [Selenomonas sp. F0473]|uniref:glucosaminidase domain-containing protein n=1 Tax=Selenomonas sp. F0473 TaxID=999423 RepID=UPI00029DD71C|nr:glucosaminidase domain-containing protein [Selenomonas sp. F0473]EKU71324.1 hypothetical protein HMPREF9161_01030 [Selenomonas sp. F0473]